MFALAAPGNVEVPKASKNRCGAESRTHQVGCDVSRALNVLLVIPRSCRFYKSSGHFRQADARQRCFLQYLCSNPATPCRESRV